MRRSRRADRDGMPVRRGIYLFPNLVTSMGLLLGFYAITQSFRGAPGEVEKACWAIFFAAIFDSLDGRIARMTKTTSAFGAQFDSLADLVSFGVAPAIILYNFALAHTFRPRVGWTVAFLFVVAGALRLARYNIRPTSAKRFFEGLPIPAAAGTAVFTVIFSMHTGLFEIVDGNAQSITPDGVLGLALVLSLAMVSTLPYYGFKDVDLFRRHKFSVLFTVVTIIVVIFQEPEVSLFALAAAYLVSGPIVWFVRRRHPADSDLAILAAGVRGGGDADATSDATGSDDGDQDSVRGT